MTVATNLVGQRVSIKAKAGFARTIGIVRAVYRANESSLLLLVQTAQGELESVSYRDVYVEEP